MKRWTIFESGTVFDFGKYKGKSLEDIAKIDSDYIFWCVKNIDKFLIDVELFLCYQNKYKGDFDLGDGSKNDSFILTFNHFEADFFTLNALKVRWDMYNLSYKKVDFHDNDVYAIENNPFYNDDLDMDQQDPEFWNNL